MNLDSISTWKFYTRKYFTRNVAKLRMHEHVHVQTCELFIFYIHVRVRTCNYIPVNNHALFEHACWKFLPRYKACINCAENVPRCDRFDFYITHAVYTHVHEPVKFSMYLQVLSQTFKRWFVHMYLYKLFFMLQDML